MKTPVLAANMYHIAQQNGLFCEGVATMYFGETLDVVFADNLNFLAKIFGDTPIFSIFAT